MADNGAPGGGRRWKWALLAVGALVLFGMLVGRAWNPPAAPPGPAASFEITELPVPMAAPELRVETGSEKPFSLDSARGQVLLVNFWATWCPPCLEEMPSLTALSGEMQKLYPGRFQVVAVSVDEGWEPVRKLYGQSRPGGMVLGLDRAQQATRAYYCTARGGCPSSYKFPESYIVDGRGRLVAYVVGSRDWSHPEIRRFLRSLIGG
jgi:thiol-disulfide isomerase/thioredoxin